jgi:hypothetical protein
VREVDDRVGDIREPQPGQALVPHPFPFGIGGRVIWQDVRETPIHADARRLAATVLGVVGPIGPDDHQEAEVAGQLPRAPSGDRSVPWEGVGGLGEADDILARKVALGAAHLAPLPRHPLTAGPVSAGQLAVYHLQSLPEGDHLRGLLSHP